MLSGCSMLRIRTRIGGLVGVEGRFTDVHGRLEVSPEGTVRVEIAAVAASLTTGSPRQDRLFTASGLIDPAAGPLIYYRAVLCSAVVQSGADSAIEGTVSTRRGTRALRLTVRCSAPAGRGVRAAARGQISREDIGFLLARPGCERLLGTHAQLDLLVQAAPRSTGVPVAATAVEPCGSARHPHPRPSAPLGGGSVDPMSAAGSRP